MGRVGPIAVVAARRADQESMPVALRLRRRRGRNRRAVGLELGRTPEHRRELLVFALRGDRLDVVPIVLAWIDVVVHELVVVRFVGRAAAENRLLGDLDEFAVLAVAAENLVAEVF